MTDIQNIDEYIQEKQESLISIHNEVIIGAKKYSFSYQEVLDGAISMYLPEEIAPMNGLSIKLKYPMEDRPEIILTTMDETVNFLFTPTDFEFSAMEAKSTIDGFRTVIKRMNPSFTIRESQLLHTEQDKEIYWFDYRSPVLETELYNLMYVTEIRGTLLIGGFNCLSEHRHLWKTLVLQMLKTISVREVRAC